MSAMPTAVVRILAGLMSAGLLALGAGPANAANPALVYDGYFNTPAALAGTNVLFARSIGVRQNALTSVAADGKTSDVLKLASDTRYLTHRYTLDASPSRVAFIDTQYD